MAPQLPPPIDNTRQLALYYKETCPFCMKVLEAMQSLNIDGIERCNTYDEENTNTLITEGSKRQVPCCASKPKTRPFGSTNPDAIINYLQRSFQ